MQAMLLAAGLGTRLRPYTLIRPKPLFPIVNRPLLHILLDMLRQAGCQKIVVNSHHLAGQIAEALEGRENLFHQYEPEILGTGGSLRQALAHFADEPVLVVNGDIVHAIDLPGLYDRHLHSGARITMAMHDYPRFNTVPVRDGLIRTFRPGAGQDAAQTLAFTGVHVVDPSVIEMIPQHSFFHIIDLYEELLGQGEQIGCHRTDGSDWRDIGTPGDYLELHAALLTGRTPLPFQASIPENNWVISSEARLPGDARLSGWGCIGRANIGHGARLHNCVVWDGANIADGAALSNAIVTP